MLKLRHFTISWKISAHFDFAGKQHISKKLEQKQQKAGKVSGEKSKINGGAFDN